MKVWTELKIAEHEPVYTSGVVSRLITIPIWVLKQLDREKLVRPTRKKGCSRLYSPSELQRVSRIWHYMKKEHVNVSGIKVIMRIEKNW